MFVALSLTVPDVDAAADSGLHGGHCTFPTWATDIGTLHRLGFFCGCGVSRKIVIIILGLGRNLKRNVFTSFEISLYPLFSLKQRPFKTQSTRFLYTKLYRPYKTLAEYKIALLSYKARNFNLVHLFRENSFNWSGVWRLIKIEYCDLIG